MSSDPDTSAPVESKSPPASQPLPSMTGKPSDFRFWWLALIGAVLGYGNVFLDMINGHPERASRLIIPLCLFLWLRWGSGWARGILAALLISSGAINLFKSSELMSLQVSLIRWPYAYLAAPFVLAIGLYLVLAKQDWQHYSSAMKARRPKR